MNMLNPTNLIQLIHRKLTAPAMPTPTTLVPCMELVEGRLLMSGDAAILDGTPVLDSGGDSGAVAVTPSCRSLTISFKG